MYGKTGFETRKDYDRAYRQRKKAEEQAKKPPDPISLLTELELAYIAGLVDGEGSIHATRKEKKGTYYPFLCITMTHKPVIEWLATKVANRAYYCAVPKEHQERRKPAYSFRLQGRRAQLLCKRIMPFLRVKAEHAKVLLRWPCEARCGSGIKIEQTEFASIRENLAAELRKLNGYRYQKRLESKYV